jgi:hypothetical protein
VGRARSLSLAGLARIIGGVIMVIEFSLALGGRVDLQLAPVRDEWRLVGRRGVVCSGSLWSCIRQAVSIMGVASRVSGLDWVAEFDQFFVSSSSSGRCIVTLLGADRLVDQGDSELMLKKYIDYCMAF